MLEQTIEKKRSKMIYLANAYGFNSPKTIKCSQELDLLLNIQQAFLPESATYEDYKPSI